ACESRMKCFSSSSPMCLTRQATKTSASPLNKTADRFGFSYWNVLVLNEGIQSVEKVVLCDDCPMLPKFRGPVVNRAFVEGLPSRIHSEHFRRFHCPEEVCHTKVAISKDGQRYFVGRHEFIDPAVCLKHRIKLDSIRLKLRSQIV